MGNLCGSSADKYEAPAATHDHSKGRHGHAAANGAVQQKSRVPDFGLGSDFQVIKLLGTGGEGETWLCTDKRTKEEVAVKLVRRPIPKSITQIIQREIRILADLGDGNLNIVHADEVVLTRSHLGLVMEYVSGGNMVAYVTKKRETRESRDGLCMDEDEANYLFKQLIWAVQFCHQNHVAHRDLKLDNTLLDNSSPPRLKLCDFGFAKSWSASPNMDTMRIGTPEYMGPELISGRSGYDGKKVDVWASGVLLYVMLMGAFPFEMEDENYVNTAGLYSIWIQQIRTSWQENPQNAGAVGKLSPECRDLLDKMFDTNQDTRISIEGIIAHPWFNRPLPPKYAQALDQLQREQSKLSSKMDTSTQRNKERDQALQMILEKATVAPQPSEQVVRVGLTRLKEKQHALEAGTVAASPNMPAIRESSTASAVH